MPDIKGISFFGTAAEIVAGTLLLISNPDAQATSGYSTYKISAPELAAAILDVFEYTQELETSDKTIIGAINEIAQGGGGGSVLYGTTQPTAQQGTNGSLYIQYSGSAQQSNLAIVALWGKIEGEWLEISTGGGGSSTLAGLSDTTITTPSDGQSLVYDGTNSKWINKATERTLTRAQYDALSQEEKMNGTTYYITDVTQSGDLHSYSTSEQAVGTWTDGKTVYEVTVSGTTTDSSNAEVNKVIFDGTNIVDEYISVEGTLKSGASGYDNQVLGGYVNSTNHVGFYKPSSSKEVKMYYNSSAYPSGSAYKAIIRYTKSSS